MNVGFALSNHYCGGELASSSFTLGHANAVCGMEGDVSTCERLSNNHSIDQKTCCENDYLEFQIEAEYNKTVIESQHVDFRIVAAFVISYLNPCNHTTESKYLAYSPPLLDCDVQVMNQSFII